LHIHGLTRIFFTRSRCIWDGQRQTPEKLTNIQVNNQTIFQSSDPILNFSFGFPDPFIRPIHPINSIPHWTITSHIFRANVEIIENQNEQRKKVHRMCFSSRLEKEFHSYIQEEHKESETLKSMSDESKINQQVSDFTFTSRKRLSLNVKTWSDTQEHISTLH
jgi:hypothetical protein